MRPLLLALSWLLLLPARLAAAENPNATNTLPRPNILLILADDLGARDLAFQGADFHTTPNLDQLSRQGMVFTQGYAGAGNCTPSRACLWSGQYTPRHGVYAVDSTERGPRDQMRLRAVPGKSGLAPAVTTLPEALKTAGYATALFGKWHLGGPDGAPPEQQGFDLVFDPRAADPNAPGTDPQDPKSMFSLTQAAGDWMQQHTNQRFFAVVSHHAIHSALEARPETLKTFAAKRPGPQHTNVPYAACLADFDDSVGQLLGRLKDLGLVTNTLVVFTSDNGATQQSSQEPLRGNKGCYYEGGIRVPLFMRWPGVIRADSRSGIPVAHLDLFPTLLDVAGVPIPAELKLDGESLLPLLRNQRLPQRRALFWHFPGYLDTPVIRGRDPVFRTRPVSVIRKGDWKLHLFHEEWLLHGGRAGLATNNAVELYNLVSDLGERKNLAGAAAKRDELLKDLLAWIEETGAPLATDPNAKPAPKAKPTPKEEPRPTRKPDGKPPLQRKK
jgi:arylsulfatase A-like enzyme